MELPLLDPVWLRSFLSVAATSSFTKAAAQLGMRQSTVSEHVRKLEAACGIRLFVRDTHSVRLTANGEAMMGFATSILAVNGRALRHFRREDLAGTIRFGLSEDIVLAGLPRLLRQFTLEHPRVNLELSVEVSETLRTRFAEGQLDIAILKRRTSDTHGELLWQDPLVWIAARDFTLDADRPIPLVTLAPPAMTRAMALEAFEQAGRRWQFVCTSGSQSGIHAAVAAGLGVAPHSASLIPRGLKVLRDATLPQMGAVEFAMLVGRAGTHDPGKALVSAVRSSVAELRHRATNSDVRDTLLS